MENLLAVNPVAFHIGNRPIYWYGIIIAFAMIVVIIVATLFCKKKGISKDLPFTLAIIAIPMGIIFGRLFACLFDAGLDLSDYFNFSTGGMSIIGAVIGGALGLLIYALMTKTKDILLIFDITASVLLLAQAIGRWGNFFNGEVYGQVIESTSIWAKFPFAVEINGTYYQALFFYECVLNLIGFIFTSIVFFKSKRSGLTVSTYLIYYGTVRTILEPLRQSEYVYMLGKIRLSQALSILMIVIGVILLFVCANKRIKNDTENEVKNEKK